MITEYCKECLGELQYCEECEKYYCPDCYFCDCESLNIEYDDPEDSLPKEVIAYMKIMCDFSSEELNDKWEWDEDGD